MTRGATARCRFLFPASVGEPSLLLLALSRALPSLEMTFCVYPSRLPLVSPSLKRRGALRRCRPVPLPSYPPGGFARSTRSFDCRKAQLCAVQRFHPSQFCTPDIRSADKPPLRNPSFPPFFGKKGGAGPARATSLAALRRRFPVLPPQRQNFWGLRVFSPLLTPKAG